MPELTKKMWWGKNTCTFIQHSSIKDDELNITTTEFRISSVSLYKWCTNIPISLFLKNKLHTVKYNTKYLSATKNQITLHWMKVILDDEQLEWLWCVWSHLNMICHFAVYVSCVRYQWLFTLCTIQYTILMECTIRVNVQVKSNIAHIKENRLI